MKDFDGWNERKKNINEKSVGKFYHPRDIWWCTLGVNVGFEQDGDNQNYRRPVLIIKALSKETCLVVPLTTSKKEHKFRISIGTVDNKKSKVTLSQIKVIDTKRLVSKITMLDKKIFETIKKTAKDLLF